MSKKSPTSEGSVPIRSRHELEEQDIDIPWLVAGILKLEVGDISSPSLSSSIAGSGKLRSFACDIRACECATGDGLSSDGEIGFSTSAGGGLRRPEEGWIGEVSSPRDVGLVGSPIGISISGSG
jgi:hypothetical protein